MNTPTPKLGDVLFTIFSKYVTITSQDSLCCSLVATLNAWGPELAARHTKSIVQVIKFQPEYERFKGRVSDRLLALFVKKAIRNYLLDTKARNSYILDTPSLKEPNDAIEPRKIESEHLQEHTQGDEVRQTSEASNSDSYEQSRNVQRSRKRKER